MQARGRGRRCAWAERSVALRQYHDEEWGVPTIDEKRLFELLVLEGAQAGLSWSIILAKRDAYRSAFAGFDANRVARLGPTEVAQLLEAPGIVRNRLKVESAVTNARAFLDTAASHGSFASYLWGWVEGRPIVGRPKVAAEVPVMSDLSVSLSKDLKRRGFTFVGPTIVYAYLQATGVVDDHLETCPSKPDEQISLVHD
ncbi:MAG: DNA-3-methyladenine glycosylase I [Acidimicrobiales bacterium]